MLNAATTMTEARIRVFCQLQVQVILRVQTADTIRGIRSVERVSSSSTDTGTHF